MLPPASQQALDDARDAILAAIARQGVAQSRLEVRLQNVEIAMRAQSETFTKHRELVGPTGHAARAPGLGPRPARPPDQRRSGHGAPHRKAADFDHVAGSMNRRPASSRPVQLRARSRARTTVHFPCAVIRFASLARPGAGQSDFPPFTVSP